MTHQSNTEIQQFFDAQATYATVIRENYMRHADIIRYIRAWNEGAQVQARRVLEIGCGDAFVVSNVAGSLGIETYHGIDLSGNVLQTARHNLKPTVRDIILTQGDIREEVRHLRGAYDLIVAGYVLHHLRTREKRAMLLTLRSLLAPGGIFLLYDLTTWEGESRETCLHRALDFYDETWTALSPDELQHIREHVLKYDYPEPLETWTDLAAACGFRSVAAGYLDDAELFAIMQFTGEVSYPVSDP